MNPDASKSWPPELALAFAEKEKAFWASEGSQEYENADNFRKARVGNTTEELAYMKAESEGCCGSFDVEWYLDGVKVRYGFNYGH